MFYDDQYDIRQHHFCGVAGSVDLSVLCDGMEGSIHYRPREAFAPAQGRTLPEDTPCGLRALYNVAATDMRLQGIEPDDYYCYALIHCGDVAPAGSLRENYWHFDLRRLLRAETPHGKLPTAINYTVANVLPTVFLRQIASDEPLPARQTMAAAKDHDRLGELSKKAGHVFRPQVGEVVRYDTLSLHKGAVNDTGKTVHRVFMHLAFSPVP